MYWPEIPQNVLSFHNIAFSKGIVISEVRSPENGRLWQLTAVDSTAVFLISEALTGRDGRWDGRRGRLHGSGNDLNFSLPVDPNEMWIRRGHRLTGHCLRRKCRQDGQGTRSTGAVEPSRQ
jgi:hypothetical protein